MNSQCEQFNFFGNVVVMAESQKAAEKQLLAALAKNAIGCSFNLSPPQAPVSGFDAVGKPVADLIDEAAKQTIRAERLEAENDRLRKELGRAHDLAETMNGNCGEQFDRAELAEAKLAELKAWKQDWQARS